MSTTRGESADKFLSTNAPPIPFPDHSPVILDVLSPAAQPPTFVRYGVLLFLCSLALLLYVDRVCIGQAAGSIRSELHLSAAQLSFVYMAFGVAYGLFEVPTGHWGDRYGSRGVITRVAIWWSIFTALTGTAIGLWSLMLVQFLFGAGEAGAFPNVARVITRWFPPERRGFARGAVTLSSMLGGAVAPVLAAYLIQHVGWRRMFGVFGAVGLIWAAAFYLWFRDDPATHPRVNDAERALIGDTAPRLAAAGEHVRIPWARVLSSPNTFLLAATMSASAALFYMEFQWYPTYLNEGRGISQIASGWLTGAVISGGAAGCVVGGLLSDFVLRHTKERKWSYRWCGSICLLFAALSVLTVRHVNAVWAVTLCNASALFFVQTAIPTWWAVVARISGRHGAAMWGLMNSMSGFGLLATQRMVAWIIDHRKLAGHSPQDCWPPVFDGVGIVLAAGVVCWLLTDATRSIVDPARDAKTPDTKTSLNPT